MSGIIIIGGTSINLEITIMIQNSDIRNNNNPMEDIATTDTVHSLQALYQVHVQT